MIKITTEKARGVIEFVASEKKKFNYQKSGTW